MRICVIGIGDSGESRLVRDLLEAQGHQVRLTLAGKPSDVFASFGFYGATADAAILSAHGDEKGIIFPEMSPDADTLVLPGDRLTPAVFRDHLSAVPPVVVSTACDSGSAAFAAAFAEAGTTSYVAPDDYPEGADIAIWVAVFFRTLAGGEIKAALARANAAVSADSGFRTISA